MVQIGTIEYEARVTNADEARAQMGKVDRSFTRTGESAEEAGAATGFLAGKLSTTGDAAQDAKDDADDTDTSFTLLSGTTWVLTRALSGLVGLVAGGSIFGTLAGGAKALASWLAGGLVSALGTVGGYLSGFVGWLAAGSTAALAVGAAIGAVIGLFGVWILEITGVLDWIGNLGETLANSLPGWARDGILSIIGLFAGPLAVIGAFIVGFIRGGFDKAFALAGKTIDIFFGAFKRTLYNIGSAVMGVVDWIIGGFNQLKNWGIQQFRRLGAFAAGVWNGLKRRAREAFDRVVGAITDAKAWFFNQVGKIHSEAKRVFGIIKGIVESPADAMRNAWNRAKNKVVGFLKDLRAWAQKIIGWLEDVIDKAAQAANTARDVSPVGGPGGGASSEGAVGWTGFPVDVPFAASGGTVAETGAAVVHKGETIVPADASAAMKSGGGGGGGVSVDTVQIELSGEFDPSNVRRRELDKLADRLVERIGAKTNRRSGVR